MANLENYNKVLKIGKCRCFSEKFKKDIVKGVERNKYSVREVSDLYDVSKVAVYKWIHKYSILYHGGYRQIVEPMSSTKKIKELQDTIKELERAIGSKQIRIDYLEKLIAISEKDYGIDIKKKGSRPSSGFGKTGKN
jgi:transposase-like protein